MIPVRNDADRLKRCLASIVANSYPRQRIELIVVDNGSTDRSAEVGRAAGATVLCLPGLRVGELRNRGAAAAHGRILAFVDADHVIDARWIRTAVDCVTDSSVGVAGAPYHAPADGTWVQRAYDGFRRRASGRHAVEWVASGNLVMRRNAFERVGGFDARLEACEDVDFCRRIRLAGLQVMSDDKLRSVHYGDPATLGSLFMGELWRGRNNMRVSLGSPRTPRGLLSVMVPLAGAVSLLGGLVGLIRAPQGLWLTGAALAVFGAMSILQTVLIARRSNGVTSCSWVQLFAVAVVFGLARALALLIRVPHRSALGRT